MPNRCNVANCCSNYDCTDYIPIFQTLNHLSKGIQDKWRKFLHRADAWELTKVFIYAKHLVTMMYYFILRFPRQMVQYRKFPANLVFGKMPSLSIYLTAILIHKDPLHTQNVCTDMKLII